jgi:hypothetical protein
MLRSRQFVYKETKGWARDQPLADSIWSLSPQV